MNKVLTILFLYAWLIPCVKIYGQPLVMVHHNSFDSYYDLQSMCPAIVIWDLYPDDFSGNLKPKSRRFKTDAQLPPPRVKDSDLKGSGYVRGHMCPAGDRDSRKDMMKETYLTSNLCPMTMVCNSGPWKSIEDSCRYLARKHGALTIAAGPIYTDDSLGFAQIGRIRVPNAFFKIARCKSHPAHTWIWIIQNTWYASKPLRVSTRTLEQVVLSRLNITAALKKHGLID